jgi:hypothetical protein
MQVKFLTARQQKKYIYKFINPVTLLKYSASSKLTFLQILSHYITSAILWRHFISQHFSREGYYIGNVLVLRSAVAPSKSLQRTISGVIDLIVFVSRYR